MKQIFLIAIGFCIMHQTSAQSIQNKVMATGGATYIKPTAQLEFTIGEVFTSTLTSPTNSITQGFHQPSLIITQLLANEEGVFEEATSEEVKIYEENLPEDKFNVRVYPNPAIDYLHIEPKGKTDEKITVYLFTSAGQLLKSVPLGDELLKLEFIGLAPGTYMINISSDTGNFNNLFKVVKAE